MEPNLPQKRVVGLHGPEKMLASCPASHCEGSIGPSLVEVASSYQEWPDVDDSNRVQS